MNEIEIQDLIIKLLSDCEYIKTITSYKEAGVLTYNKGIIITTDNNESFHITIIEG